MNDGCVTGRIRTPARVSGRVAAAAVGASERTRRARCRDVAAASRRAARRLRTRGGQSARGGSAVVSVRRGSVPRGCEKPLSIDRVDARGSGRETTTTTYRLLESSRRRDLGGERRGVHGVERAVGCAGRAPRARSRDASSRAVSHRNASQGTARVSDWRRMGTGISADFRGDGESRLSQQWRRRRIAYYGENYSRSAVSTAVVWRSIGDVGAFTPGC